MTKEFIGDSKSVRVILRPFLEGDLIAWKGLPDISLETLSAALGKPAKEEESTLGWYPAVKYTYNIESPSRGIVAYVRNGKVVLVEARVPPPSSMIGELGDPTAIKPHEILHKNGYVYEYLYCDRGLVLSIVEPFKKERSMQIVRCRGIRLMNSPDEFGPQYYQPFEDKIVW